MSKKSTDTLKEQSPVMELLSEQALEAVTGGGHSQCEGDDESGSGGSSKPKPKPARSGYEGWIEIQSLSLDA